MFNTLLSFVAAASFSLFPLTTPAVNHKVTLVSDPLISSIPSIYPQVTSSELTALLREQAPSLNQAVIDKVVAALKCTNAFTVDHNNILVVIDYSLPSNKKRLWVFDLRQHRLLFNTYVAHGIKSGTLWTSFFSNKYNSKASSFGVYKTDKAYYGREGLSLRLEGLERRFNDNAMNRSIVMHGGWYVDEGFIKKYGRPGRSWGCPAVPLDLYQAIINVIKDNSLLVVYYPSDEWLGTSKFLNCEKKASAVNPTVLQNPADPLAKKRSNDEHSGASTSWAEQEQRDDVFFAQVAKGGEDKPILVMPADQYEQLVKAQVPLGRMLRRQIDKKEYIALNNFELNQLIARNNAAGYHALFFVIPTLHRVRGYYETKMNLVQLGDITKISPSSSPSGTRYTYTVQFTSKPSIRLQSTDRFIRWLGL